MTSASSSRARRTGRIRARLSASTLPRLSVFRSSRAIYAQVIDTKKGTVLAASSNLKEKMDAAAVGEAVGKKAIAAGVKSVVFDRSGYAYHGKVKAVADGARNAGLHF